MKKKITAMLLASIIAVSMVACSNNKKFDDASIDWGKYVTVTDYKNIEFKVEQPGEISEEQIQEQIDTVLQQNSESKDVTGRPIQNGDIANIDYEGKKDGVAFDGGTAQAQDLEIGSGTFIEGFEEGLVGKNVGETVDLPLKFPDDYQAEELAGQEVVFTVKINSIKEKVVPELNDEFVAKVSKTSKTVDEYKEEVKKSLQEQSKQSAEQTAVQTYWQKVVEGSQMDKYPDGYLDSKENEIKKSYEDAAKQNKLSLEEFLKQNFNVTVDEFNKQISEGVKDGTKQTAVLREICKKEKISISKDEYNKKAEEIATQSGFATVEALEKQYGKNAIEETMLWEQLSQKILNNEITA